MEKIKIFIAGSKDLRQERNCIKVLANDLNSKYASRDIMVIIHSYEHFDDKQEEYNRFIEKEADLVFFILDGRMGERTEEEFLKATEALNKANRPEVMMFLRRFDEVTPEIGRIQGLIRGRLGDRYYIDYSDLDELRLKARERIIRFIDQRMEEKGSDNVPKDLERIQQNKVETKPSNKKTKYLLYSFMTLSVVLFALLLFKVFSSPEPLIFAGGGSVKNYLKAKRNLDVDNYPHSVYANLASGISWSLLAEEANRFQENGGREKEHFSTICLSADDIDSTFINEKTKGMFSNARIIRYHLGEDPLVVFVHNNILSQWGIPDATNSLSVDSLRWMVKTALSKPGEVRLFTTSKTSGTLRLYQSCFIPQDSVDFERMLDSKQSFLFYQKSTSAYINALDLPNEDLPYIVLGSECYYPQTEIEKPRSHCKSFYVKNGEQIVAKPMNLYFVGKYTNRDGGYCTVRKPVIKFLKVIHSEQDVDSVMWQNLLDGKMKTDGGNPILKLN